MQVTDIKKTEDPTLSQPEKVQDEEQNAIADQKEAKALISWVSPDFTSHDRSSSWYLMILVATAALVTYLVWQKIWTGVVVAIVFCLFLLLSSRQKPKDIKCSIYDDGVVVDDKVHPFEDFKLFWITYTDIPKIRLQQKGLFAGQIVLPLENVEMDQIKKLIADKLPEEDRGEDITDMINRIIKF